jgi:hypothetical protein
MSGVSLKYMDFTLLSFTAFVLKPIFCVLNYESSPLVSKKSNQKFKIYGFS